ncbi:1011_t:CDS:2 [Scutellospora calospora]|uniref:1011_t:CDS:1 n=1 Tax=Scutellospora calospora TaxID=85575 RepID=A0ACA9KEN2_9GLOM|nr:1011_t:CDS:2 [Scutellospora calospora]
MKRSSRTTNPSRCTDVPKLRKKRHKKEPFDVEIVQETSQKISIIDFDNVDIPANAFSPKEHDLILINKEINKAEVTNETDEAYEEENYETDEAYEEENYEESEAESLIDEELNTHFTDIIHDVPLIDIIEEDPLSDEILEEKSSEFRGFDGEYGPYFPNFTSSMLYIWITKHMISTSAYEDLVKILTHDGFRKEDVIQNIRRMRKWRYRLPLLTVHQHDVPVCQAKAPSILVSTKKAFTISPLAHLEYILNNPTIMPKLYFGPGVLREEKSEFWHGNLWQDSPFFGEHEIRCNNGVTYKAGDFVLCQTSFQFICRIRSIVTNEINKDCKVKVDRLLQHHNLPNCRFDSDRHTRGNGKELWIVEGDSTFIDPENIRKPISVWLRDLPEPQTYSYYVQEIVYNFNGRWKYRDISKRHRLPCEYITIRPPPLQIPTFKIFLDIYYDNFGTYRNVYHSLGGVYMQIGNMLQSDRKLLKNHFLIGFVPFGTSFDDFIKPVLKDIQCLENGFIMSTLYGDAWVVGGIGCITADLPQGNDLAGVKRHNALHGCRTCNASIEQFTDPSYNYAENARFKQHTEKQFVDIKNQQTKMGKEQLATEYGLTITSGSLSVLKWDNHVQTLHDIYHAMAGKARTLLDATLNIFNATGEEAFLTCWKNIEKPACWCRMPNPLRHRQSFMFSDVLKLAILMPFILRRFLKPCYIKPDILKKWQENSSKKPVTQLCSLWTTEAKTLKLAFSTTMTEHIYKELQEMLNKERDMLIQLFPEYFTNLPNLHVNTHLLQHAQNFATLVNTAVGVKEIVHRTFKVIVPHTNRKVIELSLTQQYNVRQALRHVVDGWKDPRFGEFANTFSNLTTDLKLHKIFSNWYAIENPPLFSQDEENGKYINLNLEIIGIGVLNTTEDPIRLKLRVGDIIELAENSEGIIYAKIKAIFVHQANDGHNYAFFQFYRFQELNFLDSVLECPYYKVRTSEEAYNEIFWVGNAGTVVTTNNDKTKKK